jgi:hypothetical protein
VALGVFGFARSVYTNLLGKGHDIVMPADTPIDVQLSPAASSGPTDAEGPAR